MLIWISLINILCTSTEDIVLNYADKFFEAGYYEEAITEYKRFIFFNPLSENVSFVYSKIGIAYRNEKKWTKSIKAFRNSIHTASNDSTKNEREIALAVTFIASGNYSAAEILLLRVEMSTESSVIKQKASFFRGIACLYAFKWESAKEAFQEYFRENPNPELQLQIDSLLADTKNFFYKSPRDAKGLSTFIPGLGQLWAGDCRNGLNAFVLNSGLAAAIIYKLWHGFYGDAFVIYYFVARRYYVGNRYHAERIAREYNQRLNQSAAKKILDKLLIEK